MARSKAHNFTRVENVGNPSFVAYYRDEYGGERALGAPDLSVTDLVRVAGLLDPKPNGRLMNQTPGFQDILKRHLVDGSELPEAWYGEAPAPAPRPASNGNAGESELELLRRILGGTVDEDKVRAIVKDALRDVDLAALTVHVTVPGKATVKVEGAAHKLLPTILEILGRGLPVFLQGEPGTGKSHLADQAAEALQVESYAVSCNVQMSKGDLLGYRDATGTYRGTEFRKAWEHGGVFLFDEMDKSNPNILATLNQAIANGTCHFPDGPVKRHQDFYLVAAGNTWGTGATAEFVGSMKLDAATMNRYVKLSCERDSKLERALVKGVIGDDDKAVDWLTTVERVRGNIKANGLKVFCTMRDAINGGHLVAVGWTHKRALEATVTSGLDNDQRRKVLDGI